MDDKKKKKEKPLKKKKEKMKPKGKEDKPKKKDSPPRTTTPRATTAATTKPSKNKAASNPTDKTTTPKVTIVNEKEKKKLRIGETLVEVIGPNPEQRKDKQCSEYLNQNFLLFQWMKILSECGKPILKPSSTKEDPFSFPWVAAILRKDDQYPICSGALVSDRVVVTAARCTFRRSR